MDVISAMDDFKGFNDAASMIAGVAFLLMLGGQPMWPRAPPNQWRSRPTF
jgi:hypothetical protein